MYTQYVAQGSSSCLPVDAAESQGRSSKSPSYLLHKFSPIFPQGYPQVTLPQEVGTGRPLVGPARMEKRDRSLLCKRASRAFLPCPCWPSWQHVAATMQVTLKNLWSLTQFQSPSSRFSLVSTTKRLAGQAFAPVPTPATPVGGFA